MIGRRRFIAATAGGTLALVHPLWSAQTSVPTYSLRIPSRWLPTPELIRQLPRLLELATVPGIAIGVVDRRKIWDRGFGNASLDPARRVSDDTVFEGASLGKPLFAYQVLRLVEAGALDLDRPLFDYLPLAEADNPLMRRVTVRHVLSHTTGLPNWRKEPGPLMPATEPGTEYAYSGEGFFYLQRVVETVTGRPVARLMEEEVFRPFGMTETSYVWRPAFDRRMAVGYGEDGQVEEIYAAIGRRAQVVAEEWKRPMLDWRFEESARTVTLVNSAWPVLPLYMVPNVASSLLTTARDYARFLSRVVAPAPGGLPLQAATLEAMTRPQVTINSALAWGLGWGIQHDDFGEVLWHWGANNSFRNFVIADLAGGRAVVVLTNGENGPRVYERVIASLTGHDHPAFLRA